MTSIVYLLPTGRLGALLIELLDYVHIAVRQRTPGSALSRERSGFFRSLFWIREDLIASRCLFSKVNYCRADLDVLS